MALYKIFITPLCGYCAKAEQILKQNGVQYEVFERTDENTEYLHNLAPELKYGALTTYPQVFVGKKRIGGSDDLEQYAEDCLGGLGG
jgi:glutaredoxin 3|tara:strand:+ start:1206 stop:1466 length:261 start_codon:yes stop_codon:yes gene_type:complete